MQRSPTKCILGLIVLILGAGVWYDCMYNSRNVTTAASIGGQISESYHPGIAKGHGGSAKAHSAASMTSATHSDKGAVIRDIRENSRNQDAQGSPSTTYIITTTPDPPTSRGPYNFHTNLGKFVHDQGALKRVLSLAYKCQQCKKKRSMCFCSNTGWPMQFRRDQVPQMLMLSFDDYVVSSNFDLFREVGLLSNRYLNPNGCPVTATFFVSNASGRKDISASTNYSLVEKLHRHGHEVATHSVNHRFPPTWWTHAKEGELK